MTKLSRVALAAIVVCAGASRGGICAETPLPQTLTTIFTYRAMVPPTPAGVKSLDLWLPLPSDNHWQKVRDITIESPLKYQITREKRFGNRMIYIHSAKPQGAMSIVARFEVTREPVVVLSGRRGMVNADDPFTGTGEDHDTRLALIKPDRLVPTGGRYRAISRDVMGKSKTPEDKMRAVFNHVIATMQYDYKHVSPRLGYGDAAFVCDYKLGNCSDLHSYLISLARSNGIPAYLEFGFPITGVPVTEPIPADGSVSGYHCWTWFLDPVHGWVPVDAADGRRWLDARDAATKNYLFGDLVTPRTAVAMSRGRDLELQPRQKGAPLNYFIYPYAELNGAPLDVKWEVRYHLVKAVAQNTTGAPERNAPRA